MSFTRALRFGSRSMVSLGHVRGLTRLGHRTPPPAVVVTGGLEVVNQYNFRGIRQNSEGVSIWPYVDSGFTPFKG